MCLLLLYHAEPITIDDDDMAESTEPTECAAVVKLELEETESADSPMVTIDDDDDDDETTESGDSRSGRKRCHRRGGFDNAWVKEFPWLMFDTDTGMCRSTQVNLKIFQCIVECNKIILSCSKKNAMPDATTCH